MKIILFLLISSAVLFSCSEEKKEVKTIENNPLKSVALYLNYDHKSGDKHKFLLTTITSQNIEITGDTSFNTYSTQTENYTIESNIKSANQDGSIATISVTHIDLQGTMNDQSISYNSIQNLTEEERRQFIDYESLLNTPFEIAFGRDGEIVNISGAEKILDNMIKAGGISRDIPSNEKNNFTRELSRNVLTPLCQQIYRKLPDSLVRMGSDWTISYQSAVGPFSVQNNSNFKIKDITVENGDTLLIIDAGLTTVISGENKVEQNNSLFLFENPEITGTGTIRFNFSKGIVDDSETTVRVQMNMKIKTKDESGKDVEIYRNDMTINQYKVKSLL